jgi:amino acid transporter
MNGADRMNEGETYGRQGQGPERSASLTPPTQAPPPLVRASVWPTVVSIIGIIYASLGLFGTFCGLAFLFILPSYADWLQSFGMSEQDVQAMETSMPPIGWTVLTSLVGLALIILLFVGALKLLRRQASGARLCALWSWIIIPWTIIATVITLVFQLTAPAPSSGRGQQIAGAIGGVIGTVVGLAFPVFVVIWFSRPTIKSQVAQWRRRSDESAV